MLIYLKEGNQVQKAIRVCQEVEVGLEYFQDYFGQAERLQGNEFGFKHRRTTLSLQTRSQNCQRSPLQCLVL